MFGLSPINTTVMHTGTHALVHGGGGGHAVERLVAAPVHLHHLAGRLLCVGLVRSWLVMCVFRVVVGGGVDLSRTRSGTEAPSFHLSTYVHRGPRTCPRASRNPRPRRTPVVIDGLVECDYRCGRPAATFIPTDTHDTILSVDPEHQPTHLPLHPHQTDQHLDTQHDRNTNPVFTLATSPGQVHPPSPTTSPLRPWAASAHSMMAESCFWSFFFFLGMGRWGAYKYEREMVLEFGFGEIGVRVRKVVDNRQVDLEGVGI